MKNSFLILKIRHRISKDLILGIKIHEKTPKFSFPEKLHSLLLISFYSMA